MCSRNNESTKSSRVVHLLAIAGILTCGLLLAMAWASAPAVKADGTIHHVPDDFATIQAAIDAAADNDEIRVVGGEYFERLVITKSLRLSGSWDVSYTEQLPDSPTVVDAAQGGRGLTVYAAGITPTVVISFVNFIHGDASGLGGVITPTVPNAPTPGVATIGAAAAPQQSVSLDELHAVLTGLVDQGAFPGGSEALSAAMARADALLSAPRAAGVDQIAAQRVSDEIDCGGGIYVRAASLRLINVRVLRNTASQAGAGAGGGLCAVDMPAAGLQINGAVIAGNVASIGGNGFGGGLYFGGEQPATAALSLADTSFRENVAAQSGNGYGGGAFVSGASGAQFNLVVFTENTATANGRTGMGGGLFLDRSANVVLETVGAQLNNASTSLTVPDPTVDWNTGMGGGIFVNESPSMVLTSPVDDQNARSLLIANVAALKGLGRGGGIHVESSPHVRIERASFFANYAALYPTGQGETVSGGAVHLVGSPDSYLADNDFNQNMAGVFSLEDFKLLGGAVNFEVSDRITVHGNRFVENAGGTAASPMDANGGALDIGYSDSITVSDNVFAGNVANLSPTGGLGGALHVQGSNDLLIHHNTFERNRAGTSAGIGGAIVMEMPGKSDFPSPQGINDTLNNRATISANTFRDNAAALDLSGDQALLGGALALNRTNGLLVTNNVFAGNRARAGAALALLGWNITDYPPDVVRTAQIVNNTLVANPGDNGVHLEMWQTPITLTNNIIVSHTVGIHVETGQTLGMAAEVHYTVYNDNGTNSDVTPDSTLIETGAITAPVEFVSFLGGDYHLLPTSAAIDAGDPAGVPPAPAVDIEGTPRPFGWAVDIGAYEWHGPQAFLPLIYKTCAMPMVTGWAIGALDGSGGVVLRTENGGLTWTRQYTASHDLDGLAVIDAQHAWVTGMNRTVLVTADGGQTWQPRPLPAFVLATTRIKVTAATALTAWIITTAEGTPDNTGYVLHTRDGGFTWDTQVQAAIGPGGFSWIDAADEDHVWAVGGYSAALRSAPSIDPGFIWHTANGQNWSNQTEPAAGIVIGVDAVNANVAWAAGRQGVYRTLDGGNRWDFYDLLAMADANHIDSVEGGAKVWMSGDSFTVFYTDKGLAADLTSQDWQLRTPTALSDKVAFMVDFIDAQHGWIVGGAFSGNHGGVIAQTCDGGLAWQHQIWPDLQSIEKLEMAPIVR